MKKALFFFLILITMGAISFEKVFCDSPDDGALSLRRAELYRSPFSQMSLKATLKNPDSESRSVSTYRVFFKDEVKTLVAFLTPKFDKGNLLLMIMETLRVWDGVKIMK